MKVCKPLRRFGICKLTFGSDLVRDDDQEEVRDIVVDMVTRYAKLMVRKRHAEGGNDDGRPKRRRPY